MACKYIDRGRALASICILVGFASSSRARDLTFEDRVRAQEAIARVYYAHTISVTKPFEQVYPRATLEKQVLDTLRRSAALQALWKTPVTAEALRAERQRIARGTRLPERLEELYAAVGRDAFVFEECVARATLTDRLARSFFAADSRAAAADGSRPTWDAWWRSVETTFDVSRVAAVAVGATLPPAGDATCPPGDTWDPGILESAPDNRGTATALWTGSQMLIWGGSGSQLGLRYDPLTDSWTGITSVNAPPSGSNQVMVWTGSRMIVWGGDVNPAFNPGGVYDPGTDTWTATSTVDAPTLTGANFYTGVWTGAVMVVWGNHDPGRSGIYDPGTDRWSSVATAGAPQGGYGHTAVWTGSRMIVWGGVWGTRSTVGGSYDPVGNTWTSISTTSAPMARDSHTAVWTGTDMIVWGGVDGTNALYTGGRYRPADDSWQPLNIAGAPSRRYLHTAVWSGSEMIIWGGHDYPPTSSGATYGDGGRYNPASNSWSAVSPSFAPTPRSHHVAVWDGTRMIVYGGRDPSGSGLGDGARYVPSSDNWTPVSLGDAPSSRRGHTAVWTGMEMIVWGGYLSTTNLDTGSRYDPTLDRWTACAVAGAPAPREAHGAVWTGTEMVVWGGVATGLGYTNSGGRYQPSTDSWTATSTSGAPLAGRTNFSLVWTGKEMIVWGGQDSSGGSRYNPTTDSWLPATASGAPQGRTGHAAVWTGSEMIVWGGQSFSNLDLNDGGRYDPSADSWQSLPTSNAPDARRAMAAAWTGRTFVVWGGVHTVQTPYPPHSVPVNTGGRFDPESNTWTPTTTNNAAPPCSTSDFAWTGRELMVWGCTSDGSVQLYDPVADSWRTTTGQGFPNPVRADGTLVSTGDFAIQWGGLARRNGSRYSLDTDADGTPNACDSDDDNDGVLDAADCAPLDATASAAATEVDGVLLTKSTSTRLDWTGQASTRYDVAGGALATLTADGGAANAACLMNDVTDTSWSDTRPDPAAGTGYYYLVQAENVCGDGGWGDGNSGAPRQPRAACP